MAQQAAQPAAVNAPQKAAQPAPAAASPARVRRIGRHSDTVDRKLTGAAAKRAIGVAQLLREQLADGEPRRVGDLKGLGSFSRKQVTEGLKHLRKRGDVQRLDDGRWQWVVDVKPTPATPALTKAGKPRQKLGAGQRQRQLLQALVDAPTPLGSHSWAAAVGASYGTVKAVISRVRKQGLVDTLGARGGGGGPGYTYRINSAGRAFLGDPPKKTGPKPKPLLTVTPKAPAPKPPTAKGTDPGDPFTKAGKWQRQRAVLDWLAAMQPCGSKAICSRIGLNEKQVGAILRGLKKRGGVTKHPAPRVGVPATWSLVDGFDLGPRPIATREKVLAYLTQHGPSTYGDITRACGPSTSYELTTARKAGQVTSTPIEGKKRGMIWEIARSE